MVFLGKPCSKNKNPEETLVGTERTLNPTPKYSQSIQGSNLIPSYWGNKIKQFLIAYNMLNNFVLSFQTILRIIFHTVYINAQINVLPILSWRVPIILVLTVYVSYMGKFRPSSVANESHAQASKRSARNRIQHQSATRVPSHRAALLALVPESSQFYSEGSHLLRLGFLFVRGAYTLAALLITRACHTATQATLHTLKAFI